MIQQRSLAYTDPDLQVDEPAGPTVGVGDIRLFTMVLGAVTGAAIAATSHPAKGDEQQKWLIFALVATLLGVAAGEAFGFGLSRWAEVKQYHVIKRWRVWLSVLLVLLVAAGLVASTPYIFQDSENLTQNGIALSALAIIGGLPIALTLAAIKQVVADPLPGNAGQQLDALLRLRRMAARMLSQLGLLVLLVMGVNAAALDWGLEKQNPNVVIFSGVVASFVVGMMYVPSASTLRKRGAIYVERYFPLANVITGQLITAADDRLKLEKMLGLDQTTFGELRAGFVVLTPVLVGLIASLVPSF
ncbi:hypothetical protein Rhe02_79160 [Rhizocola hellebori]|uniref:Uncharacterized protein n=1 Tax=Rhizocola hellebori TaxID=1392758 RepID=A0A8J3VJX4_9ACTN|nr:hypothetical protein [Rhizocola hellebori]GIH09849.1 hypothetical protein Rhe02_79160 [Rhizocola hellebori]